MLKLFLIEFLIICNITITAQNNFSFSNDVYSGINSAVLSPAEPFLNPNPWDINLFSPDVFLQNDYAYISQSSIMGLRNATIETANPKKGITGENQTNVFDFYKKDKVNFLFSSDIMGPSFSIITNFREKKYVFGIFTRLRSQASVLDLDNYFKYGNQMISQPDYYEMKPFSSIIMNWNEIGLNAATTIFHYSNKQWVIGLNLKYEMGLDAAHIISQQNITLTATEPDLGTDPDKKTSMPRIIMYL